MLKGMNWHKKLCKNIKKHKNPENKTLMQIQHDYAKKLGYKNWAELKKEIENGETKKN